jgi:hypothetical protein
VREAAGVTDFGDFEDDDSFDTAPADPEQVAIRLHRFWRDEGIGETVGWDDLSAEQRARRVRAMVRLIAWWRRQGLH